MPPDRGHRGERRTARRRGLRRDLRPAAGADRGRHLADPSNFAALVRSAVRRPAARARTTVELAALRHAVSGALPAVEVPDAIVDAVCTLRAGLRRKELVASDRRWRQAVGLLQASAYLDGRPAVAETDLSVLTHVLWDSPAQRPTAEREVLHLVNPDAKEALELSDAIEELENQLDAMAGQSREALSEWVIKKAHNKCAMAGKRLEELREEAADGGVPPPPSTASPVNSGPSVHACSPRHSVSTPAWCRPSCEHGGQQHHGGHDRPAHRRRRRGPVRPAHLARHLRPVGRTARAGHGVDDGTPACQRPPDRRLPLRLPGRSVVAHVCGNGPSRLVNHQVLTALVESPEFTVLRRETVGDPYAAAMAVLAQATALRRMLHLSREAQEQAERAVRQPPLRRGPHRRPRRRRPLPGDLT